MKNIRNEVVEGLVNAAEEFGLPTALYYVFGKSLRVRIEFSVSDCKSSIDELALSVRSQNALKRARIDTLGELVNKLNEGNLKQIRNLGKKSYSEIQTKILCYGYGRLSLKERQSFFDDLLTRNDYSMWR